MVREIGAKITPVVYVIIGAASLKHMHVSSSKNYNMLSNATGCPIAPKNCTGWFFTMLNPNLRSDLLSDHFSTIQALKAPFLVPITQSALISVWQKYKTAN